jgi:hypothetical protein
VPKNFKMPKTINSYGEYLKYAGEASGVLPITPEAEAPTAAEGSLAAGPSSAVGVVLPLYSLYCSWHTFLHSTEAACRAVPHGTNRSILAAPHVTCILQTWWLTCCLALCTTSWRT